MRKLITNTLPAALAALSLTCSAAAHAQNEAPKILDFLGQDTETPSTMSELNGKACSVKGSITQCKALNVRLAGVTLRYLSLEFHDGRLYTLYGALYREDLGDVLGAFSEKYGNPRARTAIWEDRAGTTFDNPTFIWSFKGGDLELETMGWDTETSAFTFVSADNRPPPEKPVVDF